MFWNSIGRINRPTYFLALVILTVIWTLMGIFQVRGPGEFLILMLTIPRLHDIGKSGWWAAGGILAVTVIALIGAFTLPGILHDDDLVGAAGGVLVLVVMAVFVGLGCVRGQDGVNKYGEPPPPGVSFKTYRITKAPSETVADAF
jgi:uncharacterized membrane protein YhaH (DUF805 family)